MKNYTMLLGLVAISITALGTSEVQAAGHNHSKNVSPSVPLTVPHARLPTIYCFPGIGGVGSPYCVVSQSGLYKTGVHGGYYGPRNGGRLPQQ